MMTSKRADVLVIAGVGVPAAPLMHLLPALIIVPAALAHRSVRVFVRREVGLSRRQYRRATSEPATNGDTVR